MELMKKGSTVWMEVGSQEAYDVVAEMLAKK